jgi:hypothetical protein
MCTVAPVDALAAQRFPDDPGGRGGPGPCHGLTVYLGLETVVCGLVVDVVSRVRPDHLTPPGSVAGD